MSYLFFVALVDPYETVFGPQHQREDMQVLSFSIEHSEGNIPKMTMEVKNPRVGLLATGRKQWIWLARNNNGTPKPLFFGRIVGVPDNLFAEVLTINYIAQPLEYATLKQQLAETLKVRPFFDPIFLDDAHRDEPDSILNAWSALWHVDRTTLVVTVSDIIDGEDGTEVFQQSDVPADSVQVKLEQAPLNAVLVDATVGWTQRANGSIDFGARTFMTYTGASLISEWPKPLADIGGGYKVSASYAHDVYDITNAIMFSSSRSFQNMEKKHRRGDVMSIEENTSVPITNIIYGNPSGSTPSYDNGTFSVAGYGFQGISAQLTLQIQYGYLGPDPKFNLSFENYLNESFNVDQVDRPTGYVKTTTIYIPLWRVDTGLVLEYRASRQRTEHVVFVLTSNLQEVIAPLSSPPPPVEEPIKITGVDVGEPLLDVKNWVTVSGQLVKVGQIILPDNPARPQDTHYQIALNSGVVGTDEPDFPNIIGMTTVDGGVTWSDIGDTLNATAPDWSPNAGVVRGAVILPKILVWAPWQILVPPPRLIGGSIGLNEVCKGSNGSYNVCTFAGTTDIVEPSWPTTWGVKTIDGDVEWTCLGLTIPDGVTYFIAQGAGTTGLVEPPFSGLTIGTTITDNNVTWMSMGVLGNIPIGDIARRSYFPTDRGLWSLEYLIALGRAKLRSRSRACEVSFECTFERAEELSCRKNATLYDPHLPGGVATGKITSYKIHFSGDDNFGLGTITMGCPVGLGNMVHDSPGSPTYVEEGYVTLGYQYYSGGTTPLPGSDIGYSVPIDAPNDDGLVFPLTKAQVVDLEQVHGNTATQEAAIHSVLPIVIEQARLSMLQNAGLAAQVQAAYLSHFGIERELAKINNSVWMEWRIKPVDNGPFNTEYRIVTTPLEITKGIDLEATSQA